MLTRVMRTRGEPDFCAARMVAVRPAHWRTAPGLSGPGQQPPARGRSQILRSRPASDLTTPSPPSPHLKSRNKGESVIPHAGLTNGIDHWNHARKDR